MTHRLLELAERLGIEGTCAHLTEAVTHPSYANEHRGLARDYQRLEFLGDAVLSLCVSEMLMERFPDAREGDLSLMRSALVNADALAGWARDANLGEVLRLGRGADAAGERSQKNVLADAVEAIVGAVYTDLGIASVRKVAGVIVAEQLKKFLNGPGIGRDPKSELQERVQARGGASPKYRVVETIGPDHNREFVVAVDIDGQVAGEGRGRSKKQAEQDAARDAMERTMQLAPPRRDPPMPRFSVDELPTENGGATAQGPSSDEGKALPGDAAQALPADAAQAPGDAAQALSGDAAQAPEAGT